MATRIREHAERLRLAHLAEGLDSLVDRADSQPLPAWTSDCELGPPPTPAPGQLQLPGIGGWASSPAARVLVAHRRLGVYDQLMGVDS